MRLFSKNFYVRSQRVAMLVSSLAVLTACGSTASQSTTDLSQLGFSGGQTGATPTPHPGNIYNLPLADSYVTILNGAGGTTPSVTYNIQTSTTLKVKVTALSTNEISVPGYSNWSFPYGCMSVNVTVNGHTLPSGVLRVDGATQDPNSACANAPTYKILDFNNAVSGNGPTPVTISDPQYDNCRDGSGPATHLRYGCGMSPPFAVHVVASTIDIQGDGHWLDP